MAERNRINKFAEVAVILLIYIFTTLNLLWVSLIFLGPSKTVCTKNVCIKKYLEGPPDYNDAFIKTILIKNHFENSTGPLNITGQYNLTQDLKEALEEIKKLLSNKRGGTFVVLGAGDGEYQDLTLPLEREYGWSGLLVEPHPVLYSMLKSKGRSVTLSNNCVSNFIYPYVTHLSHEKVSPEDSERKIFEKYRLSRIHDLWVNETDLDLLECQCIPLENLVYAAGITKLDLLVLDMSGTDLDVLIDFRLDRMPPVEIILLRSHGNELGEDIRGYFTQHNIDPHMIFGRDTNYYAYLYKKYHPEEDNEYV